MSDIIRQDAATLASAIQPRAIVALHDANGTAVAQTTIP